MLFVLYRGHEDLIGKCETGSQSLLKTLWEISSAKFADIFHVADSVENSNHLCIHKLVVHSILVLYMYGMHVGVDLVTFLNSTPVI